MNDQNQDPNPRVGVLGGGQLGRMLVEAANRLNIRVNVLDAENTPAKQISAHSGHVSGSFTDPAAITALASGSDVLTVEIEHVDTHILEQVSKTVAVEPHWQTIRIIQNKFMQKEHLKSCGIPIGRYLKVNANTREELGKIGDDFHYPYMLKSATQAYDGRGNYCIRAEADIAIALDALTNRPLYAEAWADFTMELAVMVVKTKDGVMSFPTVETVHEDSVCKLVYAPARNVSDKMNKKAQELAKRVVETFKGKGVFGVEMFLLENDDLLVNEVAPRPHNSGHYTIEACPLSQYDAHLRAILDLPIPEESFRQREPAIMVNILGGQNSDSHLEVVKRAYSVDGASIYLYGKGKGRPGRKMGHITITAPTMTAAEKAIQPLINLVDTLRSQRSDLPAAQPRHASTRQEPAPTVAVVMGSDSDLPVLVPGLKLLKDFSIPFDVHITSAHRTPEWMADYIKAAASKGIKVIIAAAGGAAHLPGMAAAYTSLPVIGVPVNGSNLDGMDSLLSIVQMPPGVPVATIGINKSVNAALLAARILGIDDGDVRAEVESYAESARNTVLRKDGDMTEIGWEAYHEKMVSG